MIHTLINFFKISLYSEPDFYIRKVDDTHFSVSSKNGLNATITIYDRIMFVDTSFKYKNSIHLRNSVNFTSTYALSGAGCVGYCTPMSESVLSVDQFVIDNIKNTILFKLDKSRLADYFEKYDDFFQESLPCILSNKIVQSDGSRTEYTCYYDYHILHQKCYPSIHFSRKKVINKLFKYTFKATKKTFMAKKDKVVAYYVDGMFFDLCDLDTFFIKKYNAKNSDNYPFMRFQNSPNYSMPIDKKTYGLNDQLTADYDNYIKKIDISKVLLLRHEGQQYCVIKKENRKLILTYITNFDLKETILEGFLSYTSWWQKTLRNETPLQRYKKEQLITHTYFNGKVKSKKERFTLDMVTAHEKNVSQQVRNNIKSLSVHYPSDVVILRLRELDLPDTIPLNPDDLTLLEMVDI